MKEVRIAELKARLSEHLRYVRRGHVLTVLDRDTPVARLVPIEAPTGLAIRRPLGARASVADVPLPPSLRLAVDPVAILLEDRRAEA
jgi:prevent-host-death family protein